jgi:hypothetical protein
VDHFSHRDLLLDRIEEADELLVAMVLHVALFAALNILDGTVIG